MGKELVRSFVDNANAMSRALTILNVDAERGASDTKFVCSFETETIEGLKRLEHHECDCEDNGIDHVNTVLDIQAFSAIIVELVQDDGSFKHVPCLTLEIKGGKLVQLFSPPAVRAFSSRLRTHIAEGELSERRPLILRLVMRETNGARKMYWLERP